MDADLQGLILASVVAIGYSVYKLGVFQLWF